MAIPAHILDSMQQKKIDKYLLEIRDMIAQLEKRVINLEEWVRYLEEENNELKKEIKTLKKRSLPSPPKPKAKRATKS